MKEIVKTLLMEGVDESTIHRVLDVIAEEYICEFNPKPEVVNAVMQRKEDKLNANTGTSYALGHVRDNLKDTDIHTDLPKLGTQGRYDAMSNLWTLKNKVDRQGDNLTSGAQRISRWVGKKVKSGALDRNAVVGSHDKMKEAGIENIKHRTENP